MASTATRRSPNAFNFLRQIEVLERAGDRESFQELRMAAKLVSPVFPHCCPLPHRWQDWENASAVARAFSIGKAESAAISNLQTKVRLALEVRNSAPWNARLLGARRAGEGCLQRRLLVRRWRV